MLAKGTRLAAEMEVMELSARLKCFKNRHLDEGSTPVASKFELLPRGFHSDMLEFELPEPDLFIFEVLPRTWPWAEPVLELVGRTGELLRGRAFEERFRPSAESARVIGAPWNS